MKAEKQKVENETGICPICNTKDALPHFYKPEKANICDKCYLKLHQKEIPFDDYDLRPDELTKEQFAEKAGVTLRAVEIWKKEGQIAAEKIRRRVNGVVRKQLIFKVEDVKEYLKEKDEPVTLPKVETEKTNLTEQDKFLNASQMFVAENLGKFADAMNQFTENVTKQLPAAEPIETKPFLTVKDASDLTGLAQAEIKRLIEREILSSFKGSHGETMISRKEILNL